MLTFADCWKLAMMHRLQRASGFSTAAASRPTTRPVCCASLISTERWWAGRRSRLTVFWRSLLPHKSEIFGSIVSMLLIATINGWHYLFAIPLFLLSLFLVLVILVQRGRGGGLTGALGGMGGQSAFGTKAGDLFTRITIITAAIWVLLSMASLKVLNQYSTTGGLSPTERGQATPVSKMGEGLLPSATKSGEVPAEK